MKTFSIGGVHPDDKKISAGSKIEVLPIPKTVYISMAQHLGGPAKAIVAPGDKVKTGQVIGEPTGFISAYVHSSVTGTVKSVGLRKDLAGIQVIPVHYRQDKEQRCRRTRRSHFPDPCKTLPSTGQEGRVSDSQRGGMRAVSDFRLPDNA